MEHFQTGVDILENCGDHNPMHYRDIAKKALENGWLVTSGKTPEATMYAQIITDIKGRKIEENVLALYSTGTVMSD